MSQTTEIAAGGGHSGSVRYEFEARLGAERRERAKTFPEVNHFAMIYAFLQFTQPGVAGCLCWKGR